MPRKKTNGKATTKKVSKKAAPETEDEFLKRQREQGQSKSRGNWWRPLGGPNGTSGRNVVRIVPFVSEATGKKEVFVMERSLWVTEMGSRGQSIRLEDNWEEDPVLSIWDDLDDDVKKKHRLRKGYLMNVIVRKDPTGENGGTLAIARIGQGVFDELQEILFTPESAKYKKNALDLKKGRDVQIIRSGQGLKTKYATDGVNKPSAVTLPSDPIDLTAYIQPADLETREKLADLLTAKGD